MWREWRPAGEAHGADLAVLVSLHDEIRGREFPGAWTFQENYADEPDIRRVGVDKKGACRIALPAGGVEVIDLECRIAAPRVLDEADIPSSCAAARRSTRGGRRPQAGHDALTVGRREHDRAVARARFGHERVVGHDRFYLTDPDLHGERISRELSLSTAPQPRARRPVTWCSSTSGEASAFAATAKRRLPATPPVTSS